MAGRPFWSGQLRISLVSFGIQLFPATSAASEISFHQIDRKTRQRVHHLNVINGDEPVEKSEIVKGYEYSKGKYVIVEPDEVKKLRLETQRTIDVAQFVDAKELPPALFDRPYFVVPDPKDSTEAFSVVRTAMIEADKVAIGEVVFGGREHLVAIAPAPGRKALGLMAYTLRYADELRDARDYIGSIKEHAIDKKQLALANDLIRALSGPFHPEDFKDDYEAALHQLIDAKRTKSPLPVAESKPRAKVVNLMDALKRSVSETDSASRHSPPSTSRSSKNGPTLVRSRKRSRKAA
jgi:DNA end-binding protein Ku